MRIVIAVMTLIGCAGVANGQTWNVVDDWPDFAQGAQNPNGAWSYGYQTTLADPLNLYDVPESIDTGRVNAYYSSDFPPNVPGAFLVLDGGPTGYFFYLPENMVGLHPGAGSDDAAPDNDIKGEYSTVRWTAPADGLYDVDTLYQGLATPPHTAATPTADVHVIVNGVSAFSGIIDGYGGGVPEAPDPAGPSPTQSWRQILNLSAGDTVDFAVGDGENESYFSDMTGLSVSILAVPEPTTSLLIGALGIALTLGVRIR